MAFDPALHREVFGLVRTTKKELASEDSLEEYHLFLDRNEDGGPAAAVVYVIVPEDLLAEFTGILTHEIHPEYWPRIVPVPDRAPSEPDPRPPETARTTPAAGSRSARGSGAGRSYLVPSFVRITSSCPA